MNIPWIKSLEPHQEWAIFEFKNKALGFSKTELIRTILYEQTRVYNAKCQIENRLLKPEEQYELQLAPLKYKEFDHTNLIDIAVYFTKMRTLLENSIPKQYAA